MVLEDGEEVRIRRDASRARAVGDAEPPSLQDGVVREPGLGQRLLGGEEGHLGDGTHRADDLAGVGLRPDVVGGCPEAGLQTLVGRKLF